MGTRDRSIRTAAVIGLLGALAAAPGAAHAAWPGLDGRIVTSQRAPHVGTGTPIEDQEIMVWTAEGAATALTQNRTTDTQPSFSPDGRRIAYRGSRSGREQIYVMNADGTGDTRLLVDATGVFSSQPGWFPHGRRLVFRSNRDTYPSREGELYAMNDDGTGIVRLTHTVEHDERYPTISPDGTRLLFTSERSGTVGIWVANADGSDPQLLYDTPATDSAPAWSPDGQSVAFETFTTPEVDGELFVMDADPATADVPRPIASDPAAHDEGPAWSPTGTHVAFTSTRDGEHDTWVVPADGAASPVNLTATERYEESPDWQPLPYAAGGHQSCGDPFGLPGEAASVVALHAPCDTARRIADAWAATGGTDDTVEAFDCEAEPHSYDQQVVQCDHRGIKKHIAFVYRSTP